jgi:hypothetical protein
MNRRVSIGKLLIIALLGVYLLSSLWYSLSFKGRVVDDAGKAVAGAIVGMSWVVKFVWNTPLVYKEVVTDKDGNFVIPGWVRLAPSPMARLVGSPHLFVVKQGYRPLAVSSRWVSFDRNASPAFKKTVLIHKVNPQDIQNEHRHVYYFSESFCGQMFLSATTNGRALMPDPFLLKEEIAKAAHSLPKWEKNEYLSELSCL